MSFGHRCGGGERSHRANRDIDRNRMSDRCRTATLRSAAPGLRRWWMRADGRAGRRGPAAAVGGEPMAERGAAVAQARGKTFSDQGKLAPSVPPALAPANV